MLFSSNILQLTLSSAKVSGNKLGVTVISCASCLVGRSYDAWSKTGKGPEATCQTIQFETGMK